jgi:hypothetical protein
VKSVARIATEERPEKRTPMPNSTPATVKITPTKGVPVPYDTASEVETDWLSAAHVAANTAKVQQAMGANAGEENELFEEFEAEIEGKSSENAKNIQDFENFIEKKSKKTVKNYPVALGISSFLQSYGKNLGFDVAKARAAITEKLMEIANCGDPRYELKALELLGKHSDIGLFTDRSEIQVSYKDPRELQEAIVARVKRIMAAQIERSEEMSEMSLDDELRIIKDADYEEVKDGG